MKSLIVISFFPRLDGLPLACLPPPAQKEHVLDNYLSLEINKGGA